MMARCVFLILLLVACAQGARILDCDTGSIDAVEGDTSFSLTCDQYSGSISWQYRTTTSTNVDIGTCTGQSCQGDQYLSQYFQLQWLTDFSSKLSFYHTLTTARESAGFIYICGDDRCTVQVNVPAKLGTPSVVLSTPGQCDRVTVTGTVDITRVYSSQGQYTCTWIREQGGQSNVVTTKRLFPGPNMNKEDRSGRCDVTDSLDPSSATYTYKVLVYPGATEKAQTVKVVPSLARNKEKRNKYCQHVRAEVSREYRLSRDRSAKADCGGQGVPSGNVPGHN